MKTNISKKNFAFTLIELLVVIAIIAILSIVVVLTLSPAEMLRQSRDATRLSDLDTINRAIGLYITDMATQGTSLNLGNASTVFVSLIDSSSSCGSLGLPALPVGYGYHCSSATSSRNTDSNGWLPIPLKNITTGSPLGSLPVDPTNQSSTGLYYVYQTNGSQYELTSEFESQKYISQMANDGGSYDGLYQKGSKMDITLPFRSYGLVGYWPLDEGSGAVANDLSGNGNVGTLAGGAVWVPGKIQNAISFPGTIAVSNSGSIDLNNTMTLSFWIKDNGTILTYVGLINKIAYGISGYSIQRSGTSTDIYIRLDTSAGSNQTGGNIVNVLNGGWHQIDFTLNNGSVQGYKDGVPISSFTYNSGGGVSSVASSLIIGSASFIGLIDDVRIYNRALSATEVQALYNAEK